MTFLHCIVVALFDAHVADLGGHDQRRHIGGIQGTRAGDFFGRTCRVTGGEKQSCAQGQQQDMTLGNLQPSSSRYSVIVHYITW